MWHYHPENNNHYLTNPGYTIILIWIPRESQITGNERADKKTRQTITSPDALKLNDFTQHDVKSISKIITNTSGLDTIGSSKLNEIKHTILIPSIALATGHLKKNRNCNQQNANRTHIVNPSTSDEEGNP